MITAEISPEMPFSLLYPSFNSAFVSHLLAKNDLYEQQISFIQPILEKYISVENEIDFAPFVADFGESFLPLLILYFCQKKDISGYLAQDICLLINSISGKYVKVANRKMVRTRSGLAFISEGKSPFSAQIYELTEGKTQLFWGKEELVFTFPYTEKIDFSATQKGNVFYLNIAKIHFPLEIRAYQQGDKMMPLGMANYKKISDIMIDKKYSPLEKQKAFVIVDATGEILALSGFRISEKAKMTDESDKILKINSWAVF